MAARSLNFKIASPPISKLAALSAPVRLLETDVITGLLLRSADDATSPHEAVLFDKTWPVWLPVIPSLGLRVSILVLTDHRWVSVLREIIPATFFPVLHPPTVSPGPTFAFFGPRMRVPKFGTSFWECYPNLTLI